MPIEYEPYKWKQSAAKYCEQAKRTGWEGVVEDSNSDRVQYAEPYFRIEFQFHFLDNFLATFWLLVLYE